MAEHSFQEQYFVAAPVERVYAHLSEPQNYVRLSPLLAEVNDISSHVNTAGCRVIHYQAVEELRWFGVMTYRNAIDVTLTLAELNRRMISDVRGILNVRLRFAYDFAAADDKGTAISESVNVHAPALLLRYVAGEAQSTLHKRVQMLKARLEAPR
jgi:ligand-binding SRPBCC domain-containing protein